MGYESLLNNTCTIQTKSNDYTTNADGTVAETWADTYTSVKCRLEKNSATIKEIAAGLNVSGTFTLFLLYGQTISRGNRVIVDSSTYYVEDVNNAAGQGHHLECTLRLLEI